MFWIPPSYCRTYCIIVQDYLDNEVTFTQEPVDSSALAKLVSLSRNEFHTKIYLTQNISLHIEDLVQIELNCHKPNVYHR